MKPLDVEIISTGSCYAKNVITNSELASKFGISEEEIFRKTGIYERRVAPPEQVTSDLAVEAAKIAIEKADIPVSDIDMIICGTSSADYMYPSTACMVQKKLGCRNVGAVDVMAGCSGFMYAFNWGVLTVASGFAETVLVIGADTIWRYVNPEYLDACIVFGDGAGAAIIGKPRHGGKVFYLSLGSDGQGEDIIKLPAGGSVLPASYETVSRRLHYFRQQSRAMFEFTIKKFEELVNDAIEKTGLTMDDIKVIIPHQPTIRMLEKIVQRLNIPMDKMSLYVDRVGHTSSGAVPIALDKAIADGKLKRGDIFLMISMGAGLTWASSVVRY